LLKNSIQILIWTLLYNSVLFVSYEAVPHPDKNRLVVLEAKVSLFKKITFGVIRDVDTHATTTSIMESSASDLIGRYILK